MKDKEFIKNKGLYFGLYLSIFPFFYFAFGEGLSLMTYFGIFWLAWAIGVFYLLYIFVRELRNSYDFFTFKQAFTSLYLISSLGLLVLCLTKIILWKGLYEEKYVKLEKLFQHNALESTFKLQNSQLDKAFDDGKIKDDEYNNQVELLNNQKEEKKQKINELWKNGLKINFFIWNLVNNLFLFVFINLILAYFLRKKIVI